jgi:ubiquinone/menaquinone biosynthesis C-methylase UbiE
VGFYSRVVFPWLCDYALSTAEIIDERRQVLANVTGDVLELGFGTGLNLPHYPTGIRKITAVDPNVGMNRWAERRIRQRNIEVDQRAISGEQLPLDNSTFDCVVSTFTLCSVQNVNRVLAEAFRVLKPGGHLLFLEHGLSPDPAVQRWQRRLNRLQMLLGDGCHLDRNIQDLIASQPWSAIDGDPFYLKDAPKTHGYVYRGAAKK